MRRLLHELARATRLTPIEIRARWHAWRATRHRDLGGQHQDALEQCLREARDLAGAR